MIEQENNLFDQKIDTIAKIYAQAFAGFPWNENLSNEIVMSRLMQQRNKVGFNSFLALCGNEIVGTLWYDAPDLKTVGEERGLKLKQFANFQLSQLNTNILIWERELIVKPENQRQGIGTELRKTFLAYTFDTYSKDGALILTRMRNDNIPTITIASKLGYQRTGIRKQSSQDISLYHEYWYKEIKKYGK